MKVQILGTRGVPAQHGGFETFLGHLGPFLVERGHQVTIYCQIGTKQEEGVAEWKGIRRVRIHAADTPIGTMIFDWKATMRSLRDDSLILILGYNTAIYSVLYKLFGRTSLMNMDGLEWQREKWSRWQRTWLRMNEWFGAQFSTHLIADHPEIAKHLETISERSKITVIPYGAPQREGSLEPLKTWGLTPRNYGLVIARPEPENSTLEIVRGFSRSRRGYPLVVLGLFSPDRNAYHDTVIKAASDEVIFAGALYDSEIVSALRHNTMWYAHGHKVGGTNPSLVEALGSGNAVIARRNQFNSWVSGSAGRYFSSEDEFVDLLASLSPEEMSVMRQASLERFAEAFNLDRVHQEYEDLLMRFAER